ncbi:MAG TPA: hypothetical protein VGM94_03565 [Galbitalea sp.]
MPRQSDAPSPPPSSAAGHVLTVRVTGVKAGYHSTFTYGPTTLVSP